MLEIVGESMGLAPDDTYKRLKIMNDVEAIAAIARDLVAKHGLDPRPRGWRSRRCSTSSRCR